MLKKIKKSKIKIIYLLELINTTWIPQYQIFYKDIK